jgi:hypothetical protein
VVDNELVLARKKAEKAVEDMAEGQLKVAAFQTILERLLSDSRSFTEPTPRLPHKVQEVKAVPPNTSIGRILSIKSEEFFKTQRSLAEVKTALGSRGWHYALSSLSGSMQTLVQKRHLRRERVNVGGKTVWKYSNA